MRMDDIKIQICIAAGIECPEWLKQKRDGNWLAACLRLVKAGVVIIGPSGPDFCRSAPGAMLAQHAHEIACLLSEG